MDSSEPAPGEDAPGLSTEERAPNQTAPRLETEPSVTAAGDAAEAVDTPTEADSAPGEIASDTGEGAPRPRRRRRRRRRSAQPASASEAGVLGEAFSGETPLSGAALGDLDAPTAIGEAPVDSNFAETAVAHGGAATPAESGGKGTTEGTAPERPLLRLRNRNRRRRRRPAVLGLLPGHSDPVSDGEGAPPAIAAIRAALAPGQRSFSVPRRQRRHAPLAGEPVALSSGEAAPTPTNTAAEPARARRRRRRPPVDAAAPGTGQERTAEAAAAAGPAGEDSGRRRWSAGPRQGEAERGAENRAAPTGREHRTEGRGGPRDRGRDRGERRDRGGRGTPPRRVEQKLYSVDAIVDRGFEDVEEDSGETRRVHWTIVKRTTADQLSRKPVATVYVVQREGADTEFPTLGTARSAVNKTIVHPEKLTPSKAERAIAKK